MPGIVRRRVDEDDGSDSTPSISDTSSGRKRPRTSSNVDDSWLLEAPGTLRRPSVPRPGRLPPFKPGQLLRIMMKNFLTYTAATYHPGPTLNMIIGPNGTGKSSVVCAICIGLDYAPALLGRSKDLHEFVRHGCEGSTVELEFKGQPGKINPIVTLDFTKEGGKKSWKLNNRPCRAKDIHELRKSFGIQVDNLCHFLPQDRVVEFSRLTPKDRLRETLRGAAPGHMTEQYEQLKEWAAEQRVYLKTFGDRTAILKGLEERQNQQRGDVERMRQRNELLTDISFMQHTRPFAKAAEANAQKAIAKERVDALDAELTQLQHRLEPALRAVTAKETYAKKVKTVCNGRKQLCDSFQKRVEGCAKKERDFDSRAKEVVTQKESLAKEERALKSDIVRAQNKIESFKEQAKQQPVDFDPAAYNEKIRDKQRQIMTLDQKIEDTRSSGTNNTEDINGRKTLISDAQRRIRGLATQSGRQMEVLSSQSSETATAWKWIQNNKSSLKGEVYGPPVLECSLTDDRYAAMLESLFQKGDMLRIVVTCFEDLEFLTKELQRNQGLTEINIINQQTPLDRFRAPITEEEGRRLGISGWALDYLRGPEPVLATLCDMSRVHATAVSQEDVTDESFKKFEESGLSSLLTPRSYYRITRRKEYGPDATSSMVRSVPEAAKWWTSRPVDPGLETRLKQEIATWEDEISQMEHESGNVKERINNLREQKDQLETEMRDTESEKNHKQQHNAMLQGLPIKISTEQSKIEELKDRMITSREQFDNIRGQSRDTGLSRAQNSIDWATAIENVRCAWTNLVAGRIAFIEAESDVTSLKSTHAGAEAELESKGGERERAREEWQAARRLYRDAAQQWVRNRDGIEGLETWFHSLPDDLQTRFPDQLEADIDAANARLDMLQESDPRTIQQFEERARKIERTQAELATATEKVDELEQAIHRVRVGWEPQLDELVAKISDGFAASFEKTNCLGSVEVGKSTDSMGEQSSEAIIPDAISNEQPLSTGSRKGHDFENWTIEIRVSFREGEALSVLDSHRQSGGERAVSTIYYLMALQALSQAPFRVVDEINQGMDPRNERTVHGRMVDIACNGGSGETSEDGGSQYFLVTPKLLPGLEYDWRMKVHNVVSGEFMPKVDDSKAAVTFGTLLDRMRKLAGQEGQAGGDRSPVSASPLPVMIDGRGRHSIEL